MEEIKAASILQRNKSTSWFGTDYNMNLYRGCCHGCIYCDSRSNCYCIDGFDTVRRKANALEILRNELRRKVRTGVIGTGAMSDPYNPFEKSELLTRHALELIDAYGFGCAILSKSETMLRDSDIFLSIAEHSPMMCKLTVTTADDELCRLIEPNVSVSSRRFETLAGLSEKGLFTGITMMPILPFIEDSEENIRSIVKLGHEAGVRFIYPAFGVTMRSGQREYFFERPDRIFHGSGLPGKYLSRYGSSYECVCPNAKKLWGIFTEECEKFGILYKMQDIISAFRLGYSNTQLSFFE